LSEKFYPNKEKVDQLKEFGKKFGEVMLAANK